MHPQEEEAKMMVALYVVGGLLAIGMIIGDIFSVVKEDFQMAYDMTDKIKTFFFQSFQSLFLLTLAFAFSWIAVGFIYIKNKQT